VAVRVGTEFGALGHVAVAAPVVAALDDLGACAPGYTCVFAAGQTVGLVARAGTDVEGETGEALGRC
jgi:hypothetical protein